MRTIILFCLMTFLLSLDMQSQTTGKGKITGTIVDDKGAPLADVSIKLFFVKTQSALPDIKSEADGSWKKLFLRGGTWNVDFDKTGYEGIKLSVNLSEKIGDKPVDLKLIMKKIEGLQVTAELVNELEMGNELFNQKKYPEAITQYQSTLGKNPDLFIVHKYIGNCFFILGEYEKAVASYSKILEKQPSSTETMVLIANSYVNLQKSDKALEWYQKVPLAEISNIDSLYNAGVLYFNGMKYNEAISYFKKSIEVAPEFADAYYQLGMTYIALNKTSEALEQLKAFMQLAPDSPNLSVAKSIIEAYSKK